MTQQYGYVACRKYPLPRYPLMAAIAGTPRPKWDGLSDGKKKSDDFRPTIWVTVTRSEEELEAHKKKGVKIIPGKVTKKILIDTGAQRSSISLADADLLNLHKEESKVKTVSADGSTYRDRVFLRVRSLVSGKPSQRDMVTSDVIIEASVRNSDIKHSILGIDWIIASGVDLTTPWVSS